jgi:two-component system chemotaxis sensor kinase CheA
MDTRENGQLYASFLQDGEEYIKTINSDLMQLEKAPGDELMGERILRSAHSLKSEASYLGEKEIADTAHAIESVLESARKSGTAVSEEALGSLFSAADKLTEMLDLRRKQRSTGVSAETGAGGTRAGEDENAPAPPEQAAEVTEASAAEATAGPSLLRRAETRRREAEELSLPEFTAFEKRLIAEARDRGEEFFRISIDLDSRASMAYAKSYLLLNNLEQLVQVVRSEPSFSGSTFGGQSSDQSSGSEQIHAAPHHTGGEQEQEETGKRAEADHSDFRRLAFFCTGIIDRGEIYKAINIDQVSGIRISPLDYASVLERAAEEPSQRDEYVASVSVRVDGNEIEEMNGYIDELKIRTHRLRRYCEREDGRSGGAHMIPFDQIRVLTDLADGLERLARRVRTVHLKEVLEPHRRLIRDLARELQKSVELSIEGEDVAVDRRAAEIISELTVHLLRNAVVHGIETPAERQAGGKDPSGTVTIHVDRSEEFLFVQVADDGRGIDEEALQKRAEESGITEEQTGDKPLLAYLVYPGVTTQSEASEYSGRGYGLDIVYRKLRQLQDARLEVENEPGRGAAFTLILPAGFALTALQMVRFGDRIIAVPAKHIRGRKTPDPEGYSRGEKGELLWRGIPVYTPEGRVYHTGTTPPQTEGIRLDYLEKEGLLLVDELLFEKEIPEERLILYIEGSPYLHRMAISGSESTFTYLSPSILAVQ